MCNNKIDPTERKLKFIGICTLTNNEIAALYKLDILTDSELASVGIKRDALIDDYRHLHEMSQLQELKEAPSITKRFISKLKRPQFKPPRQPTTPFRYNILNTFFLCMQSEATAFCQYMENDLRIRNTIPLNIKEDRALALYDSYFVRLDNMWENGEQDRVSAIIAKVLSHFHRKPHKVKLLPGFGFGYGPHYAQNRKNAAKKEAKELKDMQ